MMSDKEGYMKYLAIILMIFVTGCVTYEPSYNDALYISDSNCDWYDVDNIAAYQFAGIKGDCKGGRRLHDLSSLPEERIIFLALGVNDAQTFSIDTFGDHLTMLLGTTSATVYCVLPTLPPGSQYPSVDEFVDEMNNRCANVIDPKDYGVLNDYGDGIHWSHADQHRFAPAISERIH